MTIMHPAGIDFSNVLNKTQKQKLPAAITTKNFAAQAPAFSGFGKLSSMHWHALSGVRFGASATDGETDARRFAAEAPDRFYDALLKQLPPTLANTINETLKHAETEARAVGSRE